LSLWRTRQDGHVASIISGIGMIVAVAPAVVLRGEMVMTAWVTVTALVVLGLLLPPVRAVCTTGYTR